MGKFPVEVAVIQSVTHYKMISYLKTLEVSLEFNVALRGFVQQYARADRSGSPLHDPFFGEGKGAAGIKNIINHQYVSIG